MFSSALYTAHRETPLSSTEKEDIKNLERESLEDERKGKGKGKQSSDSHIFNNTESLANLKEFCEQHVKIYVNEIIKPKYNLEFYITQSWLNITPPDGSHEKHCHSNSIISGIFCFHSVEEDQVLFHDPHWKFKHPIEIEQGENTPWNSGAWAFPVTDNDLFLFPSWLEHEVQENKAATTDRISLAFNVHAKGMFGDTYRKNELFI